MLDQLTVSLRACHRSAKFNFMRPHDPYYGYYEYKIAEFEEQERNPQAAAAAAAEAAAAAAAAAATASGGAAADSSATSVQASTTAAASLQRKAVIAPISKAAKNMAASKDIAPVLFEFSQG
jgi:Surp module